MCQHAQTTADRPSKTPQLLHALDATTQLWHCWLLMRSLEYMCRHPDGGMAGAANVGVRNAGGSGAACARHRGGGPRPRRRRHLCVGAAARGLGCAPELMLKISRYTDLSHVAPWLATPPLPRSCRSRPWGCDAKLMLVSTHICIAPWSATPLLPGAAARSLGRGPCTPAGVEAWCRRWARPARAAGQPWLHCPSVILANRCPSVKLSQDLNN